MRMFPKLDVIVRRTMFLFLLTLGIQQANATQPSVGEIKVSFADPPTPDQSWTIDVVAVPYVSGEYSEITYWLKPEKPSMEAAPVHLIWSGAVSKWDTIRTSYIVDPPPSGGYTLTTILSIGSDPEKPKRTTRYHLFVEVGANTVWSSVYGPSGVEFEKIMEEYRSRGYTDTTWEAVVRLAPDLAKRLRNVNASTAVSDISSRRPDDSLRPQGRGPEIENAHPGWGPIEEIAPSDSGTPRQFPSERAKRIRPRHRIEIPSSRDNAQTEADNSVQEPPKTPALDPARDSAFSMDSSVIERTLRLRQLRDSTGSATGTWRPE